MTSQRLFKFTGLTKEKSVSRYVYVDKHCALQPNEALIEVFNNPNAHLPQTTSNSINDPVKINETDVRPTIENLSNIPTSPTSQPPTTPPSCTWAPRRNSLDGLSPVKNTLYGHGKQN